MLIFATVAFSSMFIAGTAAADGSSIAEASLWADVSEDIVEAPGYEDSDDRDRKWAVSIGLTGGVAPEYEGSDDYEGGVGPNLSASWRDTIFYKGKTLGVNLVRQKNLKAGPIVAWTSGRDEDDHDNLEGLGDVDSSVEAGGFISYRKKPLRFRAEVRQDVGSGHEGALVELKAGTSLPFEKPRVVVELGTTWASDDYMESFFGIDEEQSINSGYKKYDAESGIKDVNITVSAGYKITSRWRIGATVGYKRLVGDAADSPIVDDKNQMFAGFGLSYHMGSKVLPEELQ